MRLYLITTRCASHIYEIASRNYKILSHNYKVSSRNYAIVKSYYMARTGFCSSEEFCES